MRECVFYFECAECGGDRLRLTGFTTARVTVGFSVPIRDSDPGAVHWDVKYSFPEGVPLALLVCDRCGREVRVRCKNMISGRSAVLCPEEMYQLLGEALELHGLQDEAFKGIAEVDWTRFAEGLKKRRRKA